VRAEPLAVDAEPREDAPHDRVVDRFEPAERRLVPHGREEAERVAQRDDSRADGAPTGWSTPVLEIGGEPAPGRVVLSFSSRAEGG